MKIKNKGFNSYRSYCHLNIDDVISRSSRQSSYELRLCAEISDTYNVGGHVIMLTFTYNNACLPYVDYRGERVPVFRLSDTRNFLNRLKINFYRHLIGEYKYFICHEYGSDTKRQHLHGLFFLSSAVDIAEFIRICRKAWSYGFMFPSAVGSPVKAALLRNLSAGASYAAKYVCKDISFYSLPSVSRLYDDYLNGSDNFKEIYKDCFPRIYQSNGIGASLVTQLKDDFDSVCEKGVLNPLTKKYAPVPPYVLNKFFWKSVPAFDSRVGKNDKPLYDRVCINMDAFVKYYLSSLDKQIDKYKVLFDGSLSDFDFSRQLYDNIKQFRKFFGTSNTFKLCSNFVVYRNYVRNYSARVFEFSDFSDLFTFETVKTFLSYSCDTYSNYVDFSDSVPAVSYLDSSFVSAAESLCNIADYYFNEKNKVRIENNRKAYDLKRSLTKKRYPVNLC